jgi:hypothetical protein
MEFIMAGSSLINLGELAKPATVLIEKISDAVGGVFKPYQIVRVAKADAAANQIRTEAQIQITDLQRRAMYRFLEEEAKKQSNIEDITQKALPHLRQDSTPQDIEDDWITNFFDKSRIISDSDMQQLWSRVLAGEANSPRSFSRRTVNLLSDLEKRDAELFATLCGFGWIMGDIVPLVFDSQDEIYNQHGINFSTLLHLESLGLIQFNNLSGFVFQKINKLGTASYYGTVVNLTFPNDKDNNFEVGKVLFTKAGQELAHVCDSKPIDGFFDFVCKHWERQSLMPAKVISEGGSPFHQ